MIFLEMLLHVLANILGAFCGWMMIRYFEQRRYFWGTFYFILLVRLIVMICTV